MITKPRSPIFQADLLRLRRNLLLWTLAFAPAVAVLAAVGLVLVGLLSDAWMALVGLLVPWLLATDYLLRLDPHPWNALVPVSLDESHLRVGSSSVPREDLTAALVLPGADVPTVVVQRRGGSSFRLVATHEEAAELRRALGLEGVPRRATLRALSLPLSSTRHAFLGFVVLNAIAILVWYANLGLWAFAGVLLGGLGCFYVPSRVRVDRSGVTKSWLGFRSRIPLDEITGARLYDEQPEPGLHFVDGVTCGVRLATHRGEVRIAMATSLLESTNRPEPRAARTAEALLLLGCIRDCLREREESAEWAVAKRDEEVPS